MELFLLILAFCVFVGTAIFIISQIKKWQTKKKNNDSYLNDVVTQFIFLKNYITKSMEEVQIIKNFYGADEVERKLKQINITVNSDIENAIVKIKKHPRYDNIKKISTDISILDKKAKSLVDELFANITIEKQLRTHLEKQIEDTKRKVIGAIPQAQKMIDIIVSENDENIWRGFDYKNLNTNVDTLFEKAERSVSNALNALNVHMYAEAKQHATDAVSYANNAVQCVQSIFSVNSQINEGKELYNRFISRIPNMISSAQIASQNDKVFISSINLKYQELQKEIQKNKSSDWILIGALIKFIMSSCKHIESGRGINNYNYHYDYSRGQ